MKNIINKFNLIAAVLFITVFTSCDAILDQDETDFGKGPILPTFVNTTDELNIIKDAANTPVEYDIPITFYGGRNVPLDKDLDISIATSADSELTEGVEFEILTKDLTIPAGETTATASIRVLTGPLVPFDFKDIVLEITESTESIAENNKIVLTIKALDENTLAGTYVAEVGEYWNSGTYQSSYAGSTWVIAAISPGLYRHEGIGFWPDDNDFYFTVDDTTGVITVLTKDLNNEPTLLNGSPIMTCAGGQFEMVTCDDTTNKRTLSPDGHHIVELTTGYYRGAGATREFLEKLVRQ